MKIKLRLLALILVMATVISVPIFSVSAATLDRIDCIIYYKDDQGNTIWPTSTFPLNVSNSDQEPVYRKSSPVIPGYVLRDLRDMTVTFEMMDKHYPTSPYDRVGTATYTVVYVPQYSMTVDYRYYREEGEAAPSVTIYGKPDEAYSIASPKVPNYRPDRQYLTGNFDKPHGYDTVYYHRISYTISFRSEGGVPIPATITRPAGTPYQLRTALSGREGYIFLGWSESASADSVMYAVGDWIDENRDLLLYAVWEPITYTISFDACGGIGAPSSLIKYYEQTVTLPTVIPERYGYRFLGWSRDRTASTPSFAPGGLWQENADVTLYAVWEKLPEQYTVTFHPNGGAGEPPPQIKTEGEPLLLSQTVPYRTGYTFLGWAESPSASDIDYMPHDLYIVDSSIILYAVWSPETYQIRFDANGGIGGPTTQIKTHDIPLSLSEEVPVKSGYRFLGWSQDRTAQKPDYYAGGLYTDEGETTLYAVWDKIHCDFSVDELTVNPEQIWQHDTITVRFRLTSKDKLNEYADIPVEIYLGDSLIYATAVDFRAEGISYVAFDLNVGARLGKQLLEVRVNWNDRQKEETSENNTAAIELNIDKRIELDVSQNTPNGDFVAGTEVISSFYVDNETASDILPSDRINFVFEVFTENSAGDRVMIAEEIFEQVVVPAHGRNLVWFKWRVPENGAGELYWLRGRVVDSAAGDTEIAATFCSVVPSSRRTSQTPNTHYEQTAPIDYDAGISAPEISIGTATWNVWAYENDTLVLKKYGLSIGDGNPVVVPDPSCSTSVFSDNGWHIKSGYGVALSWSPFLTAAPDCLMPNADSYTGFQEVTAVFPEFRYQSETEKYRTLEKVGDTFRFAQNHDAAASARLHFIPLYIKNGDYTISVTATELWTPAGKLTVVRHANTLHIDGTIYDDWY